MSAGIILNKHKIQLRTDTPNPHSYFQAWYDHVRGLGMSEDQHEGFQDSLRRDLGDT